MNLLTALATSGTLMLAAASAPAMAQSVFGYGFDMESEAITLDDRAWPRPADAAPDSQSDAVHSLLTGTFAGTAGEGEAAARVLFHGAPVTVDGLDNALYFEVAREDSPEAPFRQGIMHVYHARDQVRLRVFDFGAGSGVGSAVVGLWLAPDAFPKVSVEALSPNMDLVLKPATGGGYTGATPHPALTVRAGAVELSSEIAMSAREIRLADRGFDAAGTQVWGPAPGQAWTLAKTEPTATVQRMDGGLVVIDLAPNADGAEPGLQSGGTITAAFTFWLGDGTVVEDSRRAGRSPLIRQIPGSGLQGFDTGVLGMTKGSRRRLVIPPALGFGNQGARSTVPPESTLFFDVECLWVENPAAPAETPAAQPGTPAAETDTPK